MPAGRSPTGIHQASVSWDSQPMSSQMPREIGAASEADPATTPSARWACVSCLSGLVSSDVGSKRWHPLPGSVLISLINVSCEADNVPARDLSLFLLNADRSHSLSGNRFASTSWLKSSVNYK